MKISIGISVVIFALAAWLGHAEEKRIRTARETNARLVADAKRVGMTLSGKQHGEKARITKRQRSGQKHDIHALAASLADIFRLAPEHRASAAGEERLETLSSLTSDEFVELISALRSEKCPEDGIGYIFFIFSRIHPRGTLEFLAKSPLELAEGSSEKQNIINGSIFMWSRDDPEGALEWYRKNKDKSADFSSPDTRRFLFSGISFKSPGSGFRLFEELGMPVEFVPGIMSSAAADSQLDAVAGLRAFFKARENSDENNELLSKGISLLARNITYREFADAEQWIDSANFSPSELQTFAKGLGTENLKGEDTRLWIEWMDRTLPAGEGNVKISELFSHWVATDYQAAGRWMDSLPEGSTKNTSIQSYAETVAPHDPQTAAEWAMKLPPGKQRDDTLRSIYGKWPQTDDASRAAAGDFAKEHGIPQELPESEE